MKKWKCCKCNRIAIYIYMPNSIFYCDKHVNKANWDKDYEPGAEYWYRKNGFKYGIWAKDLLNELFRRK